MIDRYTNVRPIVRLREWIDRNTIVTGIRARKYIKAIIQLYRCVY